MADMHSQTQEGTQDGGLPMNASFSKQRNRTNLSTDDALANHLSGVAAEIQSKKIEVEQRHQRTKLEIPNSPLQEFSISLTRRIAHELNLDPSDIDIRHIDRGTFNADIAIKIPKLLKENSSHYRNNILPQLRDMILGNDGPGSDSNLVETANVANIHLNLKLSDRKLFDSLRVLENLGADYGRSNRLGDQKIVVDYSSPNAAKQLHAGHIRSTIIGHVLGNLFESQGALVYRVNHINDWGGFGYILEGHNRWSHKFPEVANSNDLLVKIYEIRRTAEKAAESQEAYESLDPKQQSVINNGFETPRNYQEFLGRYQDYLKSSEEAFHRLEQGDPKDVALWEQMLEWSLKDFAKFYEKLDVHLDFTIGESYHARSGNELVQQALRSGTVEKYTQALADTDIGIIKGRIASDEIKEKFGQSLIDSINHDIGADVVRLGPDHRMVVRKADQSTIYATRDLAAIRQRVHDFDANRLVYVVGGEQTGHFKDLFDAADQLGLAEKSKVTCEHAKFGFYVNGDDPKHPKLSSRDGASNVHHLLEATYQHFINNYAKKETEEQVDHERRMGGLTREQIESNARLLSIGSIIFNDLTRAKEHSVPLSNDLNKTIVEFENAGGAYVMYTACRAKSILGKYGKEIPKTDQVSFDKLEKEEIELIKKIDYFPEIVSKATADSNPAILLHFISELSRDYNNYYSHFSVLPRSGNDLTEALQHRLVITKAVADVITNGLSFCHIQVPDRI